MPAKKSNGDDTQEHHPDAAQTGDDPALVLNTEYVLMPVNVQGQVPVDFVKASGIVHFYPLGGKELSATDRKVVNAIIVHVKRIFGGMTDVDKAKVMDENLPATPKFLAHIAIIADLVELKGRHYDRLYQALNNLWNWEFRYQVTSDRFKDDEAKSEFRKSRGRFFSDLAMGQADGLLDGQIEFVIPSTTLRMLLEPASFARLNLHLINSMRSSALISIYENCARYIGTNGRVTATLPVDEWINIISGEGLYVNQYTRWKSKVCTPVLRIIEATPEIPFRVEILERKSGRNKVVALQFRMHMKAQQSIDAELPVSWHPANVQTLKQVYLMSESDIGAMAVTATEAEVVEAISRDAKYFAKKLAEGDPIRNRAACLRSILRNVQAGKNPSHPPEIDPEVMASKRLLEAKQRMAKDQESFRQFQIDTIGSRLLELPDSDLVVLREEFLKDRGPKIPKEILTKGWAPSNRGLHALFKVWIMEDESRWSTFLHSEEERDFLVWKAVSELPSIDARVSR